MYFSIGAVDQSSEYRPSPSQLPVRRTFWKTSRFKPGAKTNCTAIFVKAARPTRAGSGFVIVAGVMRSSLSWFVQVGEDAEQPYNCRLPAEGLFHIPHGRLSSSGEADWLRRRNPG